MIGYVTLGTNDLAKAREYYDALLGSIGAKRLMEFPDEMGGFTLWGTGWGSPGIALTRPYDKQPAVAGNGNMVALVMDSRNKVDALHAKAIELGELVIARRSWEFAPAEVRAAFRRPLR